MMSNPNDVPNTDPPVSHTAAAQALVQEIRAMREKIPHFVFPESKRARRQIASVASLPAPFIELSAVAVTNSNSLVRGGAADPEKVRDMMSFAEAYLPFADELDAMSSFVRHTVASAKHEAGKEALTTYALAQRLAKQPETADLAPHVADMRIALGKRARKAKAPKTAPPKATATVEPPPEPDRK
jgi:hypothetical protein